MPTIAPHLKPYPTISATRCYFNMYYINLLRARYSMEDKQFAVKLRLYPIDKKLIEIMDLYNDMQINDIYTLSHTLIADSLI